MFKNFLFAMLVVATIFSTASAMAGIDCSPRDPRASVSSEKEGQIKASGQHPKYYMEIRSSQCPDLSALGNRSILKPGNK